MHLKTSSQEKEKGERRKMPTTTTTTKKRWRKLDVLFLHNGEKNDWRRCERTKRMQRVSREYDQRMVRTLAENPRLIAPRIGLGCVTWCHLLGFRQKRQETEISVGHATSSVICLLIIHTIVKLTLFKFQM